MDPVLIVVIVVAVVLLVALAAGGFVAARRRQRRQKLRDRFGPEYDRAVEEYGGEKEAQRKLEERQERREQLDIRPLDPAESQRYAESWRQTQAKFVDRPGEAIGEADTLVAEVMRKRGYPMDNFEQRAEDISVDHPGVVDNYRAAHRVSQAHEQGRASTEDLRQAMVHYRGLFEELLDGRAASPGGGDAGPPSRPERGPVERRAAPEDHRSPPPAEGSGTTEREERR